MFRALLLVVIVAVAVAFGPSSRMAASARMEMSLQGKISKALGVAALGVGLMGTPMPSVADGAVSSSTVYRARNSYGARIVDLGEAASKGDFAAFSEKRAVNAFDLFISASNAKKGVADKARKQAELGIQAKIYQAVKDKNSSGLKSAYDEFIKVADLTSDYKKGELGQTDSSGYSPTWGTSKQYIYQR